MTDSPQISSEAQVERLEAVNRHIAALLQRPEVAKRLHAAGADEWSAVQVLGHITEIIPYWMSAARALAAADEPPHFGRTPDSPERLEAVQRAATTDPDELLRRLDQAVRAAAADMRAMSPAQLAKTGLHNRLGQMTVSEVFEQLIVKHAEDHLAQINQALGVQA